MKYIIYLFTDMNNNIDLIALGARLRDVRNAKNWSAKKVASELGFSTGLLSKYENGNSDSPSLIHLEKMSRLLDVPFLWLCFGDEEDAELDEELNTNLRKTLSDSLPVMDVYHKKFVLQAMEMALEESKMEQQVLRMKRNRVRNYSGTQEAYA
ncbi:MAG: helix-turn-helix domain-containing protein [Cyclobacteriaceae bacterium]